MRTITIDVYPFEELSEQAQQRAIEAVREKLSGDWWDFSDNDDVAAVMVAELARLLGTPGAADYGVYDFPGIPGVQLDGWSLDRGQNIAVSGRLNRDNAPNLPWADGISHVSLSAHRSNFTTIDVDDDDEPDCTCNPSRPPVRMLRRVVTRRPSRAVLTVRREIERRTSLRTLLGAPVPMPPYLAVVEREPGCEPDCATRTAPAVTDEQRDTLEQAVRDAISGAWQAGKNEEEYRSSRDYAHERIEHSDYEFTADGDLH
jgi:hypothetical protein